MLKHIGIAVVAVALMMCLVLSVLGIFSSNSEEPIASPAPPQESPEPPSTSPETSPESSAQQEPQPPAFDENYTLDRELPVLTEQGLELPINGATGFASVSLTLWAEIPTFAEEPTVTLEPESVPQQETEANVEPGSPSDGNSSESTDKPVPSLEPDLPVEESPPLDDTQPPQESSPNTADAKEGEAAAAAPIAERLSYSGSSLAVLDPGDGFTIIQENGDWWLVQSQDGVGWVEHRYCMINLPDVIPSIIYDMTNSYSALYVSSGQRIPGVTGEAFYPGMVYNPRLERDEFLVPMLYSAAKRVCAAQHAALAQGNCLKIYEAYRPRATQLAIIEGLTALAESDPQVDAGISTSPWEISDFIATGYSNHQRGVAVDVSLVKVSATELRSTGGYNYLCAVEYEEYEMPTAMHELSMAAASTTAPGSNRLSNTMNQPAIALRTYFTEAGMTPLASEWWHFNDFTARSLAANHLCTGGFVVDHCYSQAPDE